MIIKHNKLTISKWYWKLSGKALTTYSYTKIRSVLFGMALISGASIKFALKHLYYYYSPININLDLDMNSNSIAYQVQIF